MAIYRAANPEKIREINRASRDRNREKVNADKRIAYQKNRENILSKNAAYRLNNLKSVTEKDARWRAKNSERVAENVRVWQSNNLEKVRAYGQNRRARVRAAIGKISPDIVEKLLKLQQGKCACCGKRLGNKFHLDHIIPLIRGGTNHDSNIQLLTPKCNLQKHVKDPIEFMQTRGFLL